MRAVFVFAIALAGCRSSAQSQIGTSCGKNGDCASGQCLPVDGTRAVCSAGCGGLSDCPPGWRCEPLVAGGAPLCQCAASAESCDGRDNDCNGFIDDNCGNLPQPDLAPPPPPDLATPPLMTTDKVDILFVIDDSPSTTPKQQELRARFPAFVTALERASLLASYHIGVITTDLGAGHSTSLSNCKPNGLGGKLQAIGRAASAGCLAPTGGVNFIDYNQIAGTHNLPPGQDLATTFGCMASVGSNGCGFEHVLESAYRALHDPIAENAGFVRSDAILVIVFLTDEDDCSAPPESDLFDASTTSTYGSLLSYRCTNWGVMCGSPPSLSPYGASGGPLAMCSGATAQVGGKLFEVGRYIDFLNNGVKANPRQVILASLAAPPEPFATIIANPATYAPCAAGQAIDGIKCAVLLDRSCQAAGLTSWFGDPAVRVNQVVKSARTFVQGSVCDSDYTPTLQSLATAILTVRAGN